MNNEDFPASTRDSSVLFLREEAVRRGIDLLFFAHNHFWRTIDAQLAEQNMGRAHFRALYFIARQPSLTVSDLLSFLGVSKQSLGRTLKELKARSLIQTQPGLYDRRQRELYLTASGEATESALFAALREAMSRAYSDVEQEAVTGFWQVSEALIPPHERSRIAALGK